MDGDREKILFVDDDPEVSWALGRLLNRSGFSVVTCGDGAEAIPMLEKKSFDVLITDIQMPEINGLALLEWVRKNRPGLRVVVITAFGSPTVKELSLRKGALLYLEKPLDPDLLIQVLKEAEREETFYGSVHKIDLFDYVQLMILTRTKAVIEINARNNSKGLLFFDAGEAVHAELGGLQGVDAFYKLLGLEGGSFSSLPWREPAERTIDTGGEFLLMEAARIKDESSRPKAEAAPAGEDVFGSDPWSDE